MAFDIFGKGSKKPKKNGKARVKKVSRPARKLPIKMDVISKRQKREREELGFLFKDD
jgi:hypothetical protein